MVIIFTGTSAAGKTKLSERLINRYKLTRIDIYNYVLPVLLQKGKVKDQELKVIYRKLLAELKTRTYDVIEIASDWPRSVIAGIVKILKRKHSLSPSEIILVFCDCPLKNCLKRNQKRKIPVPLSRLKKQSVYGSRFYKNLCGKLKINFFEVNTEKKFEESHKQLWRELKKIKRSF